MRLSTWLNTCRSRQRRCGRRRYSGQRLVNGDDRPPTTERLMATSFSPHRSLPWSRRTASSPRLTSAICPATFTQRSGGTSVPTPDRLSRSTSPARSRCRLNRNCRPQAPDASNVLSQEPHHAAPPSTAASSSTSNLWARRRPPRPRRPFRGSALVGRTASSSPAAGTRGGPRLRALVVLRADAPPVAATPDPRQPARRGMADSRAAPKFFGKPTIRRQ